MPKQQSVIVGIRGLWTNPNDLNAPDGSLVVADNLVIDRPGIGATRRGFGTRASVNQGPVNQLSDFGTYLIAHHGTNRVSHALVSSFTQYSGTFTAPDATSRIRFAEAASSLYMNAAEGIYELDTPTGTWRLAGAPRGLDSTAILDTTSATGGWMPPDCQVAYRHVWGYKNANGKVQLGAPSERTVVQNPAPVDVPIAGIARAGSTVTVTVASHPYATNDLVDMSPGEADFASGAKTITGTTATTFTYTEAGAAVSSTAAQEFSFASRRVTYALTIPDDITASYFLQLYRSPESAGEDEEPSDDMGLVYETVPHNVNITGGTISIVDVSPFPTTKGYFTPSGEGLLSSKERPPLARDMALFANCMFYGYTSAYHSKALTLLTAADGTGTANYNLWINNVKYTAGTTEDTATGTFKRFSDGTPAQNIENTVKSLIRVVNNYASNSTIYATYLSTPDDPPGQFLLYARTAAVAAFSVYVQSTDGSYFSPALPTRLEVNTLTRTGGNLVEIVLFANHSFVIGQTVELLWSALDANFAAGVKTITATPTATTFRYSEAGADVTNSTAPNYYVTNRSLSGEQSTASTKKNAVSFSQPDEPGAVPVFNTVFVGSELQAIQRLVPLRDRLVVMKEDGWFQITGTYPNFFVSELDTTLKLLAPESAVKLSNKIYALTNQGYVEFSEGARVISSPIEKTLNDLYAVASAAVNLEAFSIGHESGKKFFGWLPSSAADSVAKHGYVFHTNSDDWTRWPIDATCGFIRKTGVTADTVYLGTAGGSVYYQLQAGDIGDYVDAPSGSTGIAVTMQWSPLLAKAPGSHKQWTDGAILFRGSELSISMSLPHTYVLSFASEHASTFDAGVTVSAPISQLVQTPFSIPFWVSREKQRCTRLDIKLVSSNQRAKFEIQGLMLNYSTSSNKVGR